MPPTRGISCLSLVLYGIRIGSEGLTLTPSLERQAAVTWKYFRKLQGKYFSYSSPGRCGRRQPPQRRTRTGGNHWSWGRQQISGQMQCMFYAHLIDLTCRFLDDLRRLVVILCRVRVMVCPVTSINTNNHSEQSLTLQVSDIFIHWRCWFCPLRACIKHNLIFLCCSRDNQVTVPSPPTPGGQIYPDLNQKNLNSFEIYFV